MTPLESGEETAPGDPGSGGAPWINISNEARSTLIGGISALVALLCLVLLFTWVTATRPLPAEACYANCDCRNACNVCDKHNVTVLCLRAASHYSQGLHYGVAMSSRLSASFSHLFDLFNARGYSMADELRNAERFYKRLPLQNRLFAEGVSSGAEMPMSQILLLMSYPGLASTDFITTSHFFTAPPNLSIYNESRAGVSLSVSGGLVIRPVLTVLHGEDALPTAFLSFPGYIACLACFNSQGLMGSAADGRQSGSVGVAGSRPPLPTRLFSFIRESATLSDLEVQLKGTLADSSLIVSAMDHKSAAAFEFQHKDSDRSVAVVKRFPPTPLVTGNTFQSPLWGLNSSVDSALLRTLSGTRSLRNSDLLSLFPAGSVFDVLWDSRRLRVSIRMPGLPWTRVHLAPFFDTTNAADGDRRYFKHLV